MDVGFVLFFTNSVPLPNDTTCYMRVCSGCLGAASDLYLFSVFPCGPRMLLCLLLWDCEVQAEILHSLSGHGTPGWGVQDLLPLVHHLDVSGPSSRGERIQMDPGMILSKLIMIF